MTLVSGNIRFIGYSPGFLGDEAPNDSGVIENVDFQGFRTLRRRHLRKWGQHYYTAFFSPLSPFHWPQNTWSWTTLNGLNGHFTLNFYYYELTLRVIICLFTVESLYIHTWLAEMCGSGVADRDPQNIWNPQKKRIFRTCYIVGTLTNKANISI